MPSDSKKRVFVPLNSLAFEWFASGGKSYELRRMRGQFTRKFIVTGKDVELRRGYSGQSLWGVIGQVLESESLSKLLADVGFEKIIPSAKSRAEAISIAESIVGRSGPFIAFEVRGVSELDDFESRRQIELRY